MSLEHSAPRRHACIRPRPSPARRFAVLLASALWAACVVPASAQEVEPKIGRAALVLQGMTYVVSEGSRNELVVEARTAEVRPEEERADLADVHARMGSKAPEGVPGGGMDMRCERGSFDLASRDFVATGNVRGVTADGRRFRTERLHYRASDGLVWSETRVVLRDRGALLEGTGFEYYVREDRFKLRDARIRQEGS